MKGAGGRDVAGDVEGLAAGQVLAYGDVEGFFFVVTDAGDAEGAGLFACNGGGVDGNVGKYARCGGGRSDEGPAARDAAEVEACDEAVEKPDVEAVEADL